MDRIHLFDVRCWTFDVRCSFVSLLIRPAFLGPAAGLTPETRHLKSGTARYIPSALALQYPSFQKEKAPAKAGAFLMLQAGLPGSPGFS
jgi:hypothetical protein